MERIIVCIKPVPDPKEWHRLKMHPETKTLIREGIGNIINPLDRHALEAALEIKDALGIEVVLLSMAPPFVTPQLREALAMGADSAVLLTDRVFAGSDTLATSRILARGIEEIGSFDLVFLGNFTLDGSTAQVPSQLAEFLGIPNVMHITRMELAEEGSLHLTRQIENGYVRLEARPPVLLSFTREANTPRFVTLPAILAAETKEILTLSNEELGLDESFIGLGGSPTKMADLLLRKKEREGTRIEGGPEEVAARIADKIYQLGII